MIHVTNHWRWRQQKYYDCSEARFLKQSNVLYEFEGIQKCRLVQLSVAIMWTLLWGTTRRMLYGARYVQGSHTARPSGVGGKCGLLVVQLCSQVSRVPCVLDLGSSTIYCRCVRNLPSIRPPDPSFRQQIRALLDRTSLKPYLSVGVPLQQSAQAVQRLEGLPSKRTEKRGVWNGDTGGSRVLAAALYPRA